MEKSIPHEMLIFPLRNGIAFLNDGRSRERQIGKRISIAMRGIDRGETKGREAAYPAITGATGKGRVDSG